MSDVFVSYASADREAAFRIVDHLEGQGIRCWVAPRDVSPGMEYGEAIIEAIGGARALVLVLSDHSNESTFVRKEVERAVSKTKPVFPVRIREVTPSGALEFYISSAQWVDAWKSPLEQHLLPLVRSIHAMGESPPPGVGGSAPLPGTPSSPSSSTPSFRVAALLLVMAVGVGAFLWLGRSPGPVDGTSAESALTHPDPGGAAALPDTAAAAAAPPSEDAAGSPPPSPAPAPAPSPGNAVAAPAVAPSPGPVGPDREDVAFFAGRWCEPYNGLTIVYDIVRTGASTVLIRVDHPQAQAWEVPARILAIPGGFELQPVQEAPTEKNVVRFHVVDDNLLTVVFADGAPQDGTNLRIRCTGRDG
jgi:hypothetical protein